MIKARRADGTRPGGFPGADVIFQRMADSTPLRRVGLTVEGRRPMRDGQFDLGSDQRARVDCPGVLGFEIANVIL